MRVRPPTPSELAALSDHFGFGLTAAELADFGVAIEQTLPSYAVVERLTEAARPAAPAREPGHAPAAAGNRLGAWAWRLSIKGDPDGPLAGRTVAVKDNVCVAGAPLSGGSPALRGFVPDEDATIVTRLLDAGAEITGKAVCEDLCLSGGSHTAASGPVRNPWDLSRSAGGSSSGSAALLAAGEVDLAIGGDQGGSVRIPAAWCGVLGLKPTYGLVPCTGAVPIALGFDHLGPMARTVTNLAGLLAALAGPDGRDPRQGPRLPWGVLEPAGPDYRAAALDADIAGLRIALLAEGFGRPGLSDPGVDEVVRAFAARATEAGAVVTETTVPAHHDGRHVWTAMFVEDAATQLLNLAAGGPGGVGPALAAALHRGRRERAPQLAATVKLVMLLGAHLIATYGGTYGAMGRAQSAPLRSAYDRALAEADVLALPTVPMTATPLPAPGAPPGEQITRALEMIDNTCPFDVTGHPALSLPAGLVGGLPAGLMLVARHGGEATLLRAAAAYERLAGGFPAPGGTR